ncbi:MAG: cytochrome c biogenesis protein ResB [Chthonomonas sp.]|nr:cytochrome c biogenesis protein ResB [Chthonomonas sp.]
MIARQHSENSAARPKELSSKSQESFWQGNLGYPQGVVLVAFVFLLGMALHATIGYRISAQLNPVMWLMAIIVPVSLVAGRIWRKHRVIHWLTGIPVAVCVTVAVGLLAFIGGVVPQRVIQEQLHAESIWASWPFLMMMDLMLVNLVGSVGKRCLPLNYTNFVYLVTHAGLAIAIIGGAGSALLLERDIVVLFPGQPTNQAMKANGTMVALPFQMELKQFHLRTFPPILAVATLDPKAEGGVSVKPNGDFVKTGASLKLGQYKVRVKEFLPKAVYGGNGWQAAPWKTAAPAAMLEVTMPDGIVKSGWVSSGSVDAPQEHLRLTEGIAIVMPEPRPKEFRSDVLVTANGKSEVAAIKVNEPINRAGWTVYQLSYDDKAGAASAYSTLEVVRDPGIGIVYLGMALLVLGSLLHLWNGMASKEKGAS